MDIPRCKSAGHAEKNLLEDSGGQRPGRMRMSLWWLVAPATISMEARGTQNSAARKRMSSSFARPRSGGAATLIFQSPLSRKPAHSVLGLRGTIRTWRESFPSALRRSWSRAISIGITRKLRFYGSPCSRAVRDVFFSAPRSGREWTNPKRLKEPSGDLCGRNRADGGWETPLADARGKFHGTERRQGGPCASARGNPQGGNAQGGMRRGNSQGGIRRGKWEAGSGGNAAPAQAQGEMRKGEFAEGNAQGRAQSGGNAALAQAQGEIGTWGHGDKGNAAGSAAAQGGGIGDRDEGQGRRA